MVIINERFWIFLPQGEEKKKIIIYQTTFKMMIIKVEYYLKIYIRIILPLIYSPSKKTEIAKIKSN